MELISSPHLDVISGASAGEAEPSAGCAGGCGLPLAGHCRAAVPAFQGPRGGWHPRRGWGNRGRGGPELDRPKLCGAV